MNNMNTKAFFSCGGGSNLILGMGRKYQTIIFNTCIIFEKKLEWKNFYQKKKFVRKKLVGKTFFVRKNFVRKNLLEKDFIEKKIIRKFFYQKVVGVTSVT